MIDINSLRNKEQIVVAVGSHPSILQSILDFDYLSGKDKPSIIAVIASGRKFERYFFGKKEVLIPVSSSIDTLPQKLKNSATLFFSISPRQDEY